MHKELIGNKKFTFGLVESRQDLEKIYSLRFQVYCKECNFIDERDYPDRLETDKYDPHSLHFFAQDEEGVIGTARLILDSPLGFPLEEHCQGRLKIKENSLPRQELSEISRLVISKEYRKRRDDGLYYTPDFRDRPLPLIETESSRRFRPMVFGLYREIYQESKRRGINYWYALMESSLWKLLKLHGFLFDEIGREVDFYGAVTPYLAKIKKIEDEIENKYPEFFNQYFLNGLDYKYRPKLFTLPKRDVSLSGEVAPSKEKGATDAIKGVFETFTQAVFASSQKEAIFFKSGSQYAALTYAELQARVIQLGNFLYKNGIGRLDRVVLLLDNSPQWPIAFLALQYIKAIAVPIDALLSTEEIEDHIVHCNAKIVICQKEHSNRVPSFISRYAKVVNVLIIDDKDVVREIELASTEILKDRRPAQANQIAVFFHTSGTANKSKTVMLTHYNLISNAQSVIKLGIANADDVFISILPLYHSYPFLLTCLLPLLLGAQISYPASSNPSDILECITNTKVSILAGMPQLFSVLHREIRNRLKTLSFWKKWPFAKINKNVFGKHFRFMLSAGARLESKIARDFLKWGFVILEGYGLTETSFISTLNPPRKVKIGSVGKAIPGVEVRIINADTQGVGDILIKGPNVMLGYYLQPDETCRVMDEGWVFTQDTGYLDKDGYLYMEVRKDELIILGSGKKINTEELQKHYATSPFIKEICVFALEKNVLPEEPPKIAAVVVPDEDYFHARGLLNIEEKIRWEIDNLSHQLNGFKRLSRFFISKDPLARTVLGKISYYKVKEKYFDKITGTIGKESKLTQKELILISDEICQELLKHLSEYLHRQVNLSDHLELDLGLDSLSRIELLLELQQFLRIHVPDSSIVEIFYASTIRDLIIKLKPFLPKKIIGYDEEQDKFQWAKIMNQTPSPDTLKTIRIRPSFTDKVVAEFFRSFLNTLFKTLFLLKIEGKNNLPSHGPYIIYVNHTSYLDGFIIGAAVPFRLIINAYFVGFREYFLLPFFKSMVKVARLIPIDITLNLMETLKVCSYLIKNGKIICFFPEGERSIDGKVRGFKKGIGILAKELNIPLVPVYIEGAFKSWPRYKYLPRLCRIKVSFGKSITYSDLVKTAPNVITYESVAEALRKELLKCVP